MVLWTKKQKHNFKLKSVSLELYKRAKNKEKGPIRDLFSKESIVALYFFPMNKL